MYKMFCYVICVIYLMYWIPPNSKAKQKGNFFTPSLREPFKYYFADFVRKGGTPPPLYGLFFRQKRSYGFGGYPPPLYGFPPENLSSKRAKNGVFCSKNT